MLQKLLVQEDQHVTKLNKDGSVEQKTYSAENPDYQMKRMNLNEGLYDLVTYQNVGLEGKKLLNFKLTNDRSTAVLTTKDDEEITHVRLFNIETCEEFRRF